MYFEIIDNKNLYCNKLFINRSITDNYSRTELSSTWDYNPHFKDLSIKYGSLYSQGKNLIECCPEEDLDQFKHLVERHFAFQNSLSKGKVSLNDNCFYDLVPESFTIDFFSYKSKINQHVVENTPEPKNYDFLVQLADLIYFIRKRKLNIDLTPLLAKAYEPRIKQLAEKIKSGPSVISYNQFGSVTGRLTTNKDSFPILTLNKEFRSILKPNNDMFVELDYNAAEFRSLLHLAGCSQPKEDIHEFHMKKLREVMNDDLTREQVKTRMFKWLYGGNVSLGIAALEKIYDKEKILDQYWDGKKVVNPFDREVECDHYHAMSYLNQSTLSDLFLRKAIEIHQFLEGRKSYVSWMVHDSLTIDLAKEDVDLLPQIKQKFEETDFGRFLARAKVGTDFNNLKEAL